MGDRSNSVIPIKEVNEQNLNQRYKSYGRVEGYIKHLYKVQTNQMDSSKIYDQAHEKTSKFKTESPGDCSKVSRCPKPNNKRSSQSPVYSNHSIPEKPQSPSKKRLRPANPRALSSRESLFLKKQKILLQERCSKCFKQTCLCVKSTLNSFFSKLLQNKFQEKLCVKTEDQNISYKYSALHRRSATNNEGYYSDFAKQSKTKEKIKLHPLGKALNICSYKYINRATKKN